MKNLLHFVIILLFLIAMVSLTACSETPSENITAPGETPDETTHEEIIVFAGLGEEEIEVTLKELKELPAVTREVTSINAAGEEDTYEASGTLLETVLAEIFDMSKHDFTVLRFVASDGYSIEVPEDILKNRDIILAYEIDGEPLEEQSKPLRSAIPDERAMFNVKQLIRIEFLESSDEMNSNKVYFFETAVTQVEHIEYTDDSSTETVINIQDFIKKYSADSSSDRVFLKAGDGLEKFEKSNTFLSGLLRITGENAPVFFGPDMPRGMNVQELMVIVYGENAFFNTTWGLEVFLEKTVEENHGVSLEDICREVNMVDAEQYLLTALDGYTAQITRGDLRNGIVYIDDDGKVSASFEGLPKQTWVKSLLSLEAEK